MGVPCLARLILKKYKNTHYWKANQKVDYFLIDYNCMMYTAYYAFISNKKYKHTLDTMSPAQFENKLINEMINYTINVVCNIVKPLKGLYIAMDGPPPRAKMQVQRFRRYAIVKSNEYINSLKRKYNIPETQQWDTTNLTPGTKFMSKFSEKMIEAINANKFYINNPLNIIFSDTTIAGEGEHKIMPYIKSLKTLDTDIICIHSNDADLIVLSFQLTSKNIIILRDVTSDDEKKLYPNSPYYYLCIPNYRVALIDELSLNHLDKEKVVYDYIFLTFFGGNDFVKSIPYLKVKESQRGKGLNILLSTYVKLIDKHQQHLVAVDMDGKAHINTFMVKQLIGEISQMEDYNMKAMQRNRLNYAVQSRPMRNEFKEPIDKDIATYQHTPYYSSEHPEYDLYKKDFDAIDYSKPHREWKPDYYKHFFGLSDKNKAKYNSARKAICINYLESLKFSFEYYVSGVPSWTWYYRYTVAPLASDLNFTISNLIEDINTDILLEKDEPFTPLELLMFVVPPQKSHLLPAKLGDLMINNKSPIIEYYPTSYIVDAVGGEKNIYADPILPDIDKDKMLATIRPIIKTLDENDKKRNILNTSHTIST